MIQNEFKGDADYSSTCLAGIPFNLSLFIGLYGLSMLFNFSAILYDTTTPASASFSTILFH
ncbi:hypothetical protein [Oceanobacillus jeddahense]|uniref:hypothetical protein n=1 Tax=Oceanobacillus jeddahense TaxID=1462527 RepID=UPI000AC4EF76|nr:hypothetical protein [Oceanobacillus jeddahense]